MSQLANTSRATACRLLAQEDPSPVEVVNRSGASPVLLLCEHAGRAVPASLAQLGLEPCEMEKHIAWDIGAAATARHLAALLGAPLVLQAYSRLVIDANRPLSAPDCIPDISDGVLIPGNTGLDTDARIQRFEEIHKPLHDTVAALLDQRKADGRPGVLVTIHSFTPHFGGQDRAMAVGLLFNRDSRLAEALRDALAEIVSDHTVVLNAPYAVDDVGDYAIPVHGEQRGIPHVLIELRNDLIDDEAGQERWAAYVYEALNIALTRLEISQ
ncbi:N-formylglutamate amidohydrolase [Roseovarius aestuarii]|nr:N-formylglutamate amidohydrolase [Roseovarius aestuarii]